MHAEVVACHCAVRIMVVSQQYVAVVVVDIPLCCAYYGCNIVVRDRTDGTFFQKPKTIFNVDIFRMI